ncbi:MAG: GUN4 domain-containing protein, partial [Hassallia sp.]
NTKQQVLCAGIAYANLKLREHKVNRDKKAEEAKKSLEEAKKYLSKMSSTEDDSSEGLQVKILKLRTKGSLSKQNKDNKKAIEFYQQAFDTLNQLKNQVRGKENAVISPPFNPNIKTKLLSKENVEALHREFMGLLQKKDKNYLTVSESLKEHFYDELENLLANKKWQQADERTWNMMLFIANREKEGFLDYPQIKNFSCPVLKQIDVYWLQNSNMNFGFSVQKKIWVGYFGDRLGIKAEDWNNNDTKNYLHFASAVGWYDEKQKDSVTGGWMGYEEYMKRIKKDSMNPAVRGAIPSSGGAIWGLGSLGKDGVWFSSFFSRAAICKL